MRMRVTCYAMSRQCEVAFLLRRASDTGPGRLGSRRITSGIPQRLLGATEWGQSRRIGAVRWSQQAPRSARGAKGVVLMARTPVTTLDPRYSNPGAVATSWEVTSRALESDQVFWISTVRSGGRPHVTPCTALWLDGTLSFQAGPTHQKFRNLKANPHVILTTGCNHWEPGLDVMVEGDAAPVSDNHILDRLAREWKTRTDGRFSFVVRNGCFFLEQDEALATPILVLSVTPTQVLAFARGDVWSHTVHRF